MIKIYNPIKLLLLALIILIASCSKRMVIQDLPKPEVYETTDLVLGADSVFQCWMSYEYDDGDCMVFYVHLVNYSVLSAQFDPADCYLEYKGAGPDDVNLRVYALNPEAEIKNLAMEKEKIDSKNSQDLGFNIVSAVFNIAVNIFDDETGDEDEIVEDVFYLGGSIADNIEINKENENFYKEASSFWKNEVLRKTIVKSGEEAGGLVYIPIQRRTRKFTAVVPFAGTINIFECDLQKVPG